MSIINLKQALILAVLALMPLKILPQVSPLFLLDDKVVTCLAKNIYHEARGESAKGQLAVALVTLNRVNHTNFPDSVCDVVYAKHQFSWTKKRLKIVDSAAWIKAKEIAYKAISEYEVLKQFKATHFHHVSINPGWNLKRVSKIGNHVFYK